MNPTSVTQDNFLTSFRYLVVAAGSYAAGKGYITSETYNNILTVAVVLGPLAWGLYVNWQKSQQAKVIQAAGVQAGINLAVSGEAVDEHGNTISKFAPGATPPKDVTLESSPQIVAKFAPDPATIAKA